MDRQLEFTRCAHSMSMIAQHAWDTAVAAPALPGLGRPSPNPQPTSPPAQALGIAIDLGPAGVNHCLDQAGIAFMYAPRYHPGMKAVRPVRSALKVGKKRRSSQPLQAHAGKPFRGEWLLSLGTEREREWRGGRVWGEARAAGRGQGLQGSTAAGCAQTVQR